MKLIEELENNSIDLLWTDPPYNINISEWDKIGDADTYEIWLKSWLTPLKSKLKPTASGYICIDWRYSYVLHKCLIDCGYNVLNRITWKRDKGRGSSKNFKNIHEDIFFFSVSKDYTFNINDIMVKKEVIAPYRDENGNPKDWFEDETGKWRYTHPGNLWTEHVVPFWSSFEVRSYAKTKRTPGNHFEKHPTQKPLDLVKKCILASSNEGDTVLDMFGGSGTTAVACLQLNRKCIIFERDETYIQMIVKRVNVECKLD